MLRPYIIRDCDGGTVLAPQRAQVDHAGAGGPQERVAAAAYHFGPIVDAQRHARGAERPQIAHAVGRRPYERARLTRLGLGQADHRAVFVQVVGDACGPAEGAEVDHRARLDDDEGVLRWGDGAAAVPRYLAAPVDGERLALVPPERAEIEARAGGQQVGVKVAEPGVASAGDFAAVVDVVGRGIHAGERLQVDDPQRLLPQERPGAAQGVAARADDLTSAVHRFPLAHGTAQGAEVLNGDRDGDQRRPSSRLAHSPASTAVSDVGPSKRRTRMAARPARSTATRCRIETWPSAGL